jgi:hypothetical protein
MPAFGRRGGMSGVFEDAGTLRVGIKRAPADQASLKTSSKLLSLGRITDVVW